MMSKLLIIFSIIFTNSLFAQEFSQEEIEKLLNNSNNNLESSVASSEQVEMQNLPNFTGNEDISENDKQLKNISNSKFGFDYFNDQDVLATSPSLLDIPVDSNYSIGYNDELELLLIGSVDSLYNLRVDLSGDILIPSIGKINLNNLNLEQANKKIQLLIDQNFVGTRSFLSVTKASLKKISIIGQVINPGSYVVNPFTSVSEAIKYAGGLLEDASLRKIILKRSDGTELNIDLYSMLIHGDRSADVSLRSGDTIMVDATINFVKVSGEVFRPNTYEYNETDKFNDLLGFALGPMQKIDESRLTFNYKLNNKIITESFNVDDLVGKREIKDLYVGSSPVDYDLSLKILGSEVSNGFYPFTPQKSVKSVLDELAFSENIYRLFSILIQENSEGNKEINFFSLADSNTSQKILLKKNPELHFFSKDEIVFLSENILNQLTSPNIKNFLNPENEDLQMFSEASQSVQIFVDYLTNPANSRSFLKGVSFRGYLQYLPITGKIKLTDIGQLLNSDFSADQLVSEYNLVLRDGLESFQSNDEVESSLITSISINSSEDFIFKVEISGSVSNPGEYTVNQNTTLQDLYSMAGGLLVGAQQDAILVSRESIKELEKNAYLAAQDQLKDLLLDSRVNRTSQQSDSTIELVNYLTNLENIEFFGRVSGDFTDGSIEAQSFFLQANDFIFVPQKISTVTVAGEVLNPGTYSFNSSLNIHDFVKKAGGLNRFADKRSIYLIRANGTSEELTARLFSKPTYLQPGDTIVVPRNIGRYDFLPVISSSTKILSDLAFAAASLNALSR